MGVEVNGFLAGTILLLVCLAMGVVWEEAGKAKEREIEGQLVLACEQEGMFAIGTATFDCSEEE